MTLPADLPNFLTQPAAATAGPAGADDTIRSAAAAPTKADDEIRSPAASTTPAKTNDTTNAN